MAGRHRMRRRWLQDDKRRIVAQTLIPEVSVSQVDRLRCAGIRLGRETVNALTFEPDRSVGAGRYGNPACLPVVGYVGGRNTNCISGRQLLALEATP